MKYLAKKIGGLLIMAFIIAGLLGPTIKSIAADRVQPVGDTVVIVIDPGHGGDNLGTQSGHTVEKHMTMVTATTMYEDLCKFDNVEVYMTHTNDVDMSLKERAEFAANVNADFLFSIHYNASENHTMYGSEVWISCETPYNAYGYQFGYLHLESLAEKGLFIRGVKNRLNDEKTDYYGVIREAAALSVPAVIIEHCYVDEARDAEFVENEEDFAAFGHANALSVAKYFGLKSTELGVDYSAEATKLQPVEADKQVPGTILDKTKPDVCEIELTECDYETGDVKITVRAADYDSPLMYYSYSINGGASWTKLESWPGCNMLTGEYIDTFQLNLQIPAGRRPSIVVRAINIGDLETKSNVLKFDQAFAGPDNELSNQILSAPQGDIAIEEVPATEPAEHEHKSIGTTTFMPVYNADEDAEDTVGIMTFLKLCLVFVIILFLVVLTSQTIHYHKRRKRRQRK